VSSPFDSDGKREGTHLNNSEAPSEYKFDQLEEYFASCERDYDNWLWSMNPCNTCSKNTPRLRRWLIWKAHQGMFFNSPCPDCEKSQDWKEIKYTYKL